MQRYNPLYTMVADLIQSQMLGKVLHGYLENYASDEGLDPDHWFWDRSKSGGIFLEHGVHFFDMFEGWLGRGEVVAASHFSVAVCRRDHCSFRLCPPTRTEGAVLESIHL